MRMFMCLIIEVAFLFFTNTSQYNHKLAKNQQHWNVVEKTIYCIIDIYNITGLQRE